eukprot:15069763-Alexandrium_andersonii.AAC.1
MEWKAEKSRTAKPLGRLAQLARVAYQGGKRWEALRPAQHFWGARARRAATLAATLDGKPLQPGNTVFT